MLISINKIPTNSLSCFSIGVPLFSPSSKNKMGRLFPRARANPPVKRIVCVSQKHFPHLRYIGEKAFYLYTELRKSLGTWLQEISSCSSLTVLPGPAWVLLSKKYILFPSALYVQICQKKSKDGLRYSAL